jgi:hypothetical protein
MRRARLADLLHAAIVQLDPARPLMRAALNDRRGCIRW